MPADMDHMAALAPIPEIVDEGVIEGDTYILGNEPNEDTTNEETGQEPAEGRDAPGPGDQPNEGEDNAASETSDAPAAGDNAESTAEDGSEAEREGVSELEQKAAAFDNLLQGFTKNPVGQVTQLVQSMSETEKAHFFAAIGVQPAATPQQEAGWTDDETTVPERFVREHREHIQAIPKLQEGIKQAFGAHEQYISELAYRNAVLSQQLSLLMEHAELALPAVDRPAIDALVAQGKSYEDALKAAYVPKAKPALALKKAKEAAKPRTPANSSPATAPKVTADMSMSEMFRIAKQIHTN